MVSATCLVPAPGAKFGDEKKSFLLIHACGGDDGLVHQSADSGAAGSRPVPATSVAQDNSRLDGLLGRTGTMHLVYWLIDMLEGFVPLISLGMEG